jgi:hypothetical protein
MPDSPPLYDPPGQSPWAGVEWGPDEVEEPQTSPRAQQALILGIASLGIFGLFLGPLAIWLGYRAKQEIEAGAYQGDTQATVGMVLGMAGFVVMATWCLQAALVPALTDL